MSMAGANTPYGQTPGFSRSAPYTPTANTPFMTPYTNTPGMSSEALCHENSLHDRN